MFGYLNMLMSKAPWHLLTKLTTRHFLMYFVPIISILFTNVITSGFYSNLISPQKQWCSTLDCFAKSHLKFFNNFDERYYINRLANQSDQWQFKAINSRMNPLKGQFEKYKNVYKLIQKCLSQYKNV